MDEWRDNIAILQQIMRRRTRAYREWLHDDVGLRAALPDEQARRLLDWAERQIDRTAQATGSSRFNDDPSYDAARAVDGDLQTSWFTAPEDAAPSLRLAFPARAYAKHLWGNEVSDE